MPEFLQCKPFFEVAPVSSRTAGWWPTGARREAIGCSGWPGSRAPCSSRCPAVFPAGVLDEAIEDPDGYLLVDARGAAAGDLFALRVRGESMTGWGSCRAT